MSNYVLWFHTLAATSGWNEKGLLTAFRQRLNVNICQQMVIYDDVLGLENLIQKAISISQHLTACNMYLPGASPPPAALSATPPAPEPMQIDSYLTRVERQWRITNSLCLYCGATVHMISAFPVHPPCPVVRMNPRLHLCHALLCW